MLGRCLGLMDVDARKYNMNYLIIALRLQFVVKLVFLSAEPYVKVHIM